MESEETVEVWLVCMDCGAKGGKREIPLAACEWAEALGVPMRPAVGRCPDCQVEAGEEDEKGTTWH